MPIESKECFTNLTIDGQLYEIYQAAQSGVTSVTATAPITSTGGATPNISTSMATNRLLGRSTAGTGIMEELTPVGITVSAGNITGIGGTLGTVDSTVPRADGVGGFMAQGSDIIIDDATTATQNNVAILNAHTGQTNSALVLTPKGTGAFILGPKPNGTVTGGNARGANAVDLQTARLVASQVASGANSFAAGVYNTASNQSCFAIGINNGASGQYSIAIGDSNSASGGYSVSLGAQNQASATASSSHGLFSLSNRQGMQSLAAGRFAATGDAQQAMLVLRCKTTTNTAVEMALDGATTYLSIPSGKVISMTINISGVKSDGSAVAHYVRQYAVKNVGGTSSQVYAPVTIGSDNAAGTVIALSANDTDDTLRISVTGIASETWRWVASVNAVEIAYGT